MSYSREHVNKHREILEKLKRSARVAHWQKEYKLRNDLCHLHDTIALGADPAKLIKGLYARRA